ncbi:hypothetical protein OS493_031467 [Desmophyllum pertusum]|uniref:Uncharacterized protein n=1 Tax=Desmophyllum pertusum TaxID=174260 RepID=A0A9W9ZX55_9CNID|nr:hypothetical protein OS493_031467 [Desmophyllum pertusum]
MFPRLHPATGWPRLLTKDVVLSGYKVPSGTTVVYSNYLSGRSEKLFKFPLEFNPERWLNEELGKSTHSPVSHLESGHACALLVQRFILEYHEEPVEMKLRMFVIPDRPLRIKLFDRE